MASCWRSRSSGFLLAVSVQAGNVQDRDGAKEVLDYCRGTYPRLSLVWADSAYAGELVRWTASCCGWTASCCGWTASCCGWTASCCGWTASCCGWTASCCGWTLEIVKKAEGQEQVKGFVVQPHRWTVERTFAWLCKYRRLVRDYEYLTQSSEAMIRLAMSHLMVRRLKTT